MAQGAPTYTPQNAIDLARKFVRDATITSIDGECCDIVNSTIWTYYPWPWTQKSMTALTLVDGTQDYALNSANADLHRFLRLRIARTDSTPDEYRDLNIRDWLRPELTPRSPFVMDAACYEPIADAIRLEAAASVASGETYVIQGEYWKKPTKISTLSTEFLFPDRYFPVFVDGLKWKFYEYIGDSRAGTAQTDRNGRQTYTGQLGVFMEGLRNMAMAEDYGDEGAEYPESPIGAAAMWG